MSESLLLAGDAGYEDACRGGNLADDLRPFAIGRPRSETELSAMIRLAVRHGLRVRPVAPDTPPEGELWDVVLLRVDGLPRDVDVDRLFAAALADPQAE